MLSSHKRETNRELAFMIKKEGFCYVWCPFLMESTIVKTK